MRCCASSIESEPKPPISESRSPAPIPSLAVFMLSGFLRPPSLASSPCNIPSPSPSCVMNSCADLPCRSLIWNKRIKLNNHVKLLQMVSRPERFTNLYNPLRLDVPHTSRGRYLRISSFKGNAQNNERDKSSKSTSPKNSVGISYVPRDANSMKLHDVSISCTSQSDDVMPRSQAIQKLFRHWLTLIWADSQTQIGQEIVESPAKDLLQPQKKIYLKERGEVLKAVFEYFMGLDAPVKIPLLIFAPLYVAVTLVFGVKVSKELTPLWIIGPLVAALYVKMIQALATLYLLSFKHTVQAWKDLPIYYDTVYKYIADGNLRPARLLKMGKRNDSDSKKQRQAYEDWSDDVLGWFSQLFWPVRYRIVKVLKRAKLI